jgi:hypothetical protein
MPFAIRSTRSASSISPGRKTEPPDFQRRRGLGPGGEVIDVAAEERMPGKDVGIEGNRSHVVDKMSGGGRVGVTGKPARQGTRQNFANQRQA